MLPQINDRLNVPRGVGRKVQGKIQGVEELSQVDFECMLELMQRHYCEVHRSEFARDLNEKDWVITLRNAAGTICGFSTQVLWSVPGIPNTLVLFSGDTVVDQAYRFSSLLAGLWGKLALHLLDQHAEQSLYWFLISKGYKTYRYLPLFFHEFYPRRDTAMPADVDSKLRKIGHWRFRDKFCPALGIVRATTDSCRLRPEAAPIDVRRLKDPDIQFFVAMNPNHAQGDELCCLAPLTRANLTPSAYRVIQAAADCSVE